MTTRSEWESHPTTRSAHSPVCGPSADRPPCIRSPKFPRTIFLSTKGITHFFFPNVSKPKMFLQHTSCSRGKSPSHADSGCSFALTARHASHRSGVNCSQDCVYSRHLFCDPFPAAASPSPVLKPKQPSRVSNARKSPTKAHFVCQLGWQKC